jgi:hypothetical protein
MPHSSVGVVSLVFQMALRSQSNIGAAEIQFCVQICAAKHLKRIHPAKRPCSWHISSLKSAIKWTSISLFSGE